MQINTEYSTNGKITYKIHISVKILGLRPIRHFADIIGQYWPIADMSAWCFPICANIKSFSKAGKNARTSDLKWCNYVVCPAEGGLLFTLINEVFTVQCTDVWDTVC